MSLPFRSWFAWRPIKIDGKRVWLKWVERRYHDRWLGDGWWEYQHNGGCDD